MMEGAMDFARKRGSVVVGGDWRFRDLENTVHPDRAREIICRRNEKRKSCKRRHSIAVKTACISGQKDGWWVNADPSGN